MKHQVNTIYIALGSNLGDRLENLRQAIAVLPPQIRPVCISPVYETLPWGYSDQPSFLNAVLVSETSLKPKALLAYLKNLEVQLGRIPNFLNGPRLIDLDILFYNAQIVQQAGLIIPHPRLHERAFVLVPLSDLAPDLIHPLLQRTICDLLQDLDAHGVKPFPHDTQLLIKEARNGDLDQKW